MTTELVLNLWCVMEDRNHLIYSLARNIYAVDGTDHEKTCVLKLLAPTDYMSAQFFPAGVQAAPNMKCLSGDATLGFSRVFPL